MVQKFENWDVYKRQAYTAISSANMANLDMLFTYTEKIRGFKTLPWGIPAVSTLPFLKKEHVYFHTEGSVLKKVNNQMKVALWKKNLCEFVKKSRMTYIIGYV